MADVFISYKSERRAAAAHLAEVLRLHGYSVWFDYGLLSGRDFGRQIEQELRGAKVCVVLWCSLSVNSEWVLDEARLAKELDSYTPCWLEKVGLPLGYGRGDTIDLTPWDGAPRAAALDRLLAEVGRRVGRSPQVNFDGLRTYEETWRRFGAPSLASFALGEAAEARLGASPHLTTVADAPAGVPEPVPETAPESLPGKSEEAELPASSLGRERKIWAPNPNAPPPIWVNSIIYGAAALGLVLAAWIVISNFSRFVPGVTPRGSADAGPAMKDDVRPATATPLPSGAPGLVTTTDDAASLPDFATFRDCPACPEMVVIPAGSFLMGSPADEVGRQDDEDSQTGPGGTPVRVDIGRFAIARYETTWNEWAACVAAAICQQGPVDAAGGDNSWGRGTRPVIEVAWSDSAAFARWVDSQASVRAYRLPTEAEWEYAARAGTTTRWSFGDSESQLSEFAWFRANAENRTQPVGSKSANLWGLHDMHGNVWEWVDGCPGDNLLTPGDCTRRMARGGAWGTNPHRLRSAFRFSTSPDRFDSIGLRLARTL